MRFNIVIVGGGMVGAAMAISLKNSDFTVALIDAAPNDSPDDSRLIALNDNSVRLLEAIGIWPTLKSHAAPIEHIHVSHRGRFGIARIDCQELKVTALGYVVPAKYINTALNSALNRMTNLTVIRPATLHHLSQEENNILLRVQTHDSAEQSFSADVVIGADGSFSTVRDLLGLKTDTVDYQQSALVTSTILQREHKNTAYERFVADGAIAMLPLPGLRAATIWTAANETIKQLLTLSDDAFLRELQMHFGYRLGRLLRIEKRAVYPLQMMLVKHQKQGNVLLIGNAAHTMHPIAAQGLNLALYEVGIVAQYLQQCTSALTLQNLSVDSLKQNFNKKLSHHLTWLFSSDYFMLNVARQVGMVGFDMLPGIKKQFALRAMGRKA